MMARRAAALSCCLLQTLAGSAVWEDQTGEFLDRCVAVQGSFPRALNGSLYFAGPSLWALGDQELVHSFDGLGRLHRLYHEAERGLLCHSARFIGSKGAKAALRTCDLSGAGAFHRAKNGPWWSRLPMAGLLLAHMDNAWVNQLHFAGRLELMTDTPEVLVANEATLEVAGATRWNDSIAQTWLPAVLSTAHPLVHPDSGKAYNILLDPGIVNNDVVLFSRDPLQPETREELVRIPVGRHMLIQHSWALAKDYAVLFGHPMFLDPVTAVSATGGVDSFVEQPSKQNHTRLFLVPLNGKSAMVREIQAPPFILVHAVNAYEENGRLIIDAEGRPASEGESFYGAFMLDRVRDPEAGQAYYKEHFEGRRYGIYRLEVPLGDNAEPVGEPTWLLREPLVFPVISGSRLGRKHCFLWAVPGETLMEDAASLVKLSLCRGDAARRWRLPGHRLAAEAAFVPAGGPKEDGGWLLAPVHEAATSRAGLAVLDAASMELLSLTHFAEGDVLNWCAHSTYVPTTARGAAHETPLSEVAQAVRRCKKRAGRSAEM